MTEKVEQSELFGLNDIYRELYDLIGLDNMQKLYNQYRGFQINFPTRLYNKEFVRGVIKREFNGSNAHDLARRFGYSERWIKSIAAKGEQRKQ